MLRLTLRTARANWRRFILTSVAVVVGVSFAVGSFVLTDSLVASINHLLTDVTGHTDFVVRGQGGSRGPGGGLGGGGGGALSRASVPAALVAQVAAVPGVSQADPSITGAAQLLDKAGQAGNFDFVAVTNWPAHPDMTATQLISGRAPAGPGDVVVDTATATDRNLHLGSTVRIATARGVITERVSGTAERGGGNLGAAGSILAFTEARATEVIGTPGKIDSINVRLAPGADRAVVQTGLEAVVGPDLRVLSSDTLLADARTRIQDRLGTFNSLLLGFAGVTLFVSAFLIWNTFSVVVAQRTRELALLRAVGASTSQVRRTVIGEGLVIGLVSSIIGIGAGVGVAIGLRSLLTSFGLKLPSGALVLAPRTIVVALVVGLGVTMVSVIGPARRATRIPPIAAMAEAALPPAPTGRRGPALGLVVLAAGIGLGAYGLLATGGTTSQRVGAVAVGALLVFLGVAGLARHLAGPIIAVIGAPIGRLGGVPSKLARQNAVRNPRRTASTASALMIGLALVAMSLVVGESVKTAFGGALRQSITADVVVDAGGIAPFDAAEVSQMKATPGVTAAVPLALARAQRLGVDRGRIGITVADPAAIASVTDPGFISGGLPVDDTHLAVSKAFADDQKLVQGGTITLHADNADRTLTISGVYQRDELLDDAVARPGAVAGLNGVEAVTKTVLVISPDPAATAKRLSAVAAVVPNSSAKITDDYVTDQTSSLDIVLGIVNVLLIFAVAVAALGIANTLALSVVERVRELGLLRAVGMERRAMRRMIRIEGVLVALFGGVLGLGVGMGFGSALAATLPIDTAQLTFPWTRLALLFVLSGLLGVLASAIPARRAAKLEVLAAIAAP